MTPPKSPGRRRTMLLLAGAFIVGAALMAGVAALLVNIQDKKIEAAQFPLKLLEIPAAELNPEVWGRNFPREYSTFNKMQDTTLSTPYGGSVKYSKLEKDPLPKFPATSGWNRISLIRSVGPIPSTARTCPVPTS